MEELGILSLREEKLLSREELKNYYQKYREYAMNRKLTNTSMGARNVAPKLKNPTNKIASILTRAVTTKDVDWKWDGVENIPEGPVIFANSHQGLLDNFVWIPTTDKHAVILHSYDVSKFLLAVQLNTGYILVKKVDEKTLPEEIPSNAIPANAKLDMVRMLGEGHSIAYFPETAWLLSPNKLHLPLHFGFLDTARKANVPVVPCVHEYTYDTTGKKAKIVKIRTRYGKPIYVKEDDDLLEKLEEYKEQISTMRYELIEENGVFKREEVTNDEYIKVLEFNKKNLELGKIDINNERRHIFGAKAEFYQFHHINDVPYNEYGELLETEEMIKVKKLAPKIFE